MLNITEKYLLNNFINIYELNINNFINYEKPTYNIIFDNEHITDKMINKYFYETKKYLPNLLYYSTIYSIGFSDRVSYIKYNNYLEYYKENINNINNINIEFKRIILFNYIKYLLYKNLNEIDLLEENNALNIYKDNFKYIKTINNIDSIENIVRNIVIILILKYTPSNIKYFILELINTNLYDKDIVGFSKNTLKTLEDVNFFKNYIIRIMLLDTYLLEIKENEILFDKIFKINDDDVKKSLNNIISTRCLIYVKKCIENNVYVLPNNNELLDIIIESFLSCLYNENMENDYIKEIEKINKKELKCINPIYNLR